MLNKHKDKIMRVSIDQNSLDGQDGVKAVEYDWRIMSFRDQELEIDLDFQEPIWVSASQQKDVVRVEFIDQGFFISKQGIPMNFDVKDQTLDTDYEIPTQLSDDLADVLQSAADAAGASTLSLTAGNFVLNIILAGSLSSLWQMIESQQLVVIMPMFNVMIPANAAILFNVLMQVAAFDPIPAEDTI